MFERARPAWPAKNKTENGEGNRDGEWNSEKPKVVSKFSNEQRDTTNFAVNEHVRTYLCEVCLLTSNDCRNDEHSDVTEGKTCEGVCII